MTLTLKASIAKVSVAKASICGALALALAAGAAFAQPGQGGGRGAALKAACGADIQKFCPDLGPSPELRACVRKNYESLSDNCKAFLAQMRSHRAQQQGGESSAPQ